MSHSVAQAKTLQSCNLGERCGIILWNKEEKTIEISPRGALPYLCKFQTLLNSDPEGVDVSSPNSDMPTFHISPRFSRFQGINYTNNNENLKIHFKNKGKDYSVVELVCYMV
jgi:hypothetical protein